MSDSYYDPPETTGDVIQHICESIAEYMLKDVPDDGSTNDRDCEIIEAIAQRIYDDDELSSAFQSYFIRKGKPPQPKSNVYEDAANLYDDDVKEMIKNYR